MLERALLRSLVTAAGALALLYVVFPIQSAAEAATVAALRAAWSLTAPLAAPLLDAAATALSAPLAAALARLLSLAFWDAAVLPVLLASFLVANARTMRALVGGLRSGHGLDPKRAGSVGASIAESAAGTLFSDVPWEALYEGGGVLGRGFFGEVRAGVARATRTPVAIKVLTPRPTAPDLAGRAFRLAVAAYGLDADALADHVAARLHAAAERGAGAASPTLTLATHEVRVLRALKGLQHPAFVDLLSAHATGGGAFVIVTALAGRTLRDAAPLLSFDARRLVLRRACEAVAVMHSGGLVHRDIKDDNIATRADDPTQPVLLDGARRRRGGGGLCGGGGTPLSHRCAPSSPQSASRACPASAPTPSQRPAARLSFRPSSTAARSRAPRSRCTRRGTSGRWPSASARSSTAASGTSHRCT